MSNDAHFKVMWKFKNRDGQRADYMTKDLTTLLSMLHKSEGVSKNTVQYLYVHMIHPNGDVQELVSWDEQIPEDKQENVTSIVDHVLKKVSKPRVRLKLTAPDEFVLAGLGMYKVYEAK